MIMQTQEVETIESKLQLVEPSKAEQIRATFEPMSKMVSQFEGAYNSLISESENGITEELTVKAKELRLSIAKVRINTEKVRKQQKEQILVMGRAIDGVGNVLKWAIQDKENKLKEIEDYFENQEIERKRLLKIKREELLSQYVEDVQHFDLINMHEDVFNSFLDTKKKQYFEIKQAEEDAEKKRIAEEEKSRQLEAQRIKEQEEERLRLIKENEKIKAESDKREKKLQAEIKAKKKQEEKLRKELEEKKRLEDERLENEKRIQLEAEAKIQAQLSMGDSEKIKSLIKELNQLKTKYKFKAKINKEMYIWFSKHTDKVIDNIEKWKS